MRREQRLRAGGRAVSRLLRAVASLQHHGGRPSSLCKALEAALTMAARERRQGDAAAAAEGPSGYRAGQEPDKVTLFEVKAKDTP